MIHTMRLNEKPFASMYNGKKTIELRLWDEKRRAVSVGDTIIFEHASGDGRKIKAEVLCLHVFSDFAELYASLPLEKCGYDASEIASASPDDMNEYYSPEEQRRLGVVGIEISVSGIENNG